MTIFGYDITEVEAIKERIYQLENQITELKETKKDIRELIKDVIVEMIKDPFEGDVRFGNKNKLYREIENITNNIAYLSTKRLIDDHISAEEFIDKVVDRIKRKQL